MSKQASQWLRILPLLGIILISGCTSQEPGFIESGRAFLNGEYHYDYMTDQDTTVINDELSITTDILTHINYRVIRNNGQPRMIFAEPYAVRLSVNPTGSTIRTLTLTDCLLHTTGQNGEQTFDLWLCDPVEARGSQRDRATGQTVSLPPESPVLEGINTRGAIPVSIDEGYVLTQCFIVFGNPPLAHNAHDTATVSFKITIEYLDGTIETTERSIPFERKLEIIKPGIWLDS